MPSPGAAWCHALSRIWQHNSCVLRDTSRGPWSTKLTLRSGVQAQRSPVEMAVHPMLAEAALCTPKKGVSASMGCVHSIDCCPRRERSSHSRTRGV